MKGWKICMVKPRKGTLQRTNISHLGKRNIIFKMQFVKDILVPWRVNNGNFYKESRPQKWISSFFLNISILKGPPDPPIWGVSLPWPVLRGLTRWLRGGAAASLLEEERCTCRSWICHQAGRGGNGKWEAPFGGFLKWWVFPPNHPFLIGFPL